MATLTTEKLGATVGALVIGADCERLLTDESLPAQISAALETHGALVFPGLNIDDATQVTFSTHLR